MKGGYQLVDFSGVAPNNGTSDISYTDKQSIIDGVVSARKSKKRCVLHNVFGVFTDTEVIVRGENGIYKFSVILTRSNGNIAVYSFDIIESTNTLTAKPLREVTLS